MTRSQPASPAPLPRLLEPLAADDGSWAVTEFGDAALGDARRTARLVQVARAFAARPTASLPQACGDAALLKASYRFFANPAIAPDAILAAHTHATYARLAAHPRVLAVQDTTELDFTHHPATRGLGPLGDTRHHGLLVHTTLAITPERLPLGLLAQRVWARDPATFGQQPDHKTRPITAKESAKWLSGLAAAVTARAQCPDTELVVVGDRESDVYDLFLADRPAGVELLVRASWNRRVAHPEHYLWAAVAAAPVAGQVTVTVAARAGQLARPATVTVRFRTVRLRPPTHRARERLAEVAVTAVWAHEDAAPAGVTPLEWLLLTTVPVQTGADACTVVAWYGVRWGVEVFHKVLKSGCRIEARQLETGERLERALALYSVIAWRLLCATLLARVAPEAPCTVLLEAAEWQALCCRIHQTATPPATPPTLRQAVHWIAQLGGYLGRGSDAEPGVTVLWRGLHDLHLLTTMYRIMRPDRVPPPQDVGNP